jgi:methyltransferase (TIGR00027 family)
MHEYLRARTAFFDHVVVDALERGTTQVVLGAAGYDGRAYRYAKPGVTWFELDHPATQADKLAALAHLGIQTGHVRFVAADFATDPIAQRLTDAGLDLARESLFLLEGVAVYLDTTVLDRLLRQLREVAAEGSRLAMSVSLATYDPEARARFLAAVAAMGEPARSTLAPDEAATMMHDAGWELVADDLRYPETATKQTAATNPTAGPGTATSPGATTTPDDLSRQERMRRAGFLVAVATAPASATERS